MDSPIDDSDQDKDWTPEKMKRKNYVWKEGQDVYNFLEEPPK